MPVSKILQLILTKGEDEAVVKVVSQERFPNQFGEIVPPVMVEHEDIEYIMNRQWADSIYIYHVAKKRSIDDLLGD